MINNNLNVIDKKNYQTSVFDAEKSKPSGQRIMP